MLSHWIQHLTNQHKASMDLLTLNFDNFPSFITWKEGEELSSRSQFIQKCSPYTSTQQKVWYFYCNRSGGYTSRGKQLRQLKSQGTNKIGSQCTAHIKAKVNEETGGVTVTYCSTHNHSKTLAHVQIPPRVRIDIAAKLQQGVGMERVLDDIRDNVANELGREHLVTRQDLHNIRSQYNIDGMIRHKNDLISVLSWVTEMNTLEHSPVLFFKPQGEENKMRLEMGMDNHSKDDFVLIVQTESQKDMLRKFGSLVLCIDSTHKTNAYDFYLTTLLVIDNFGEGLPLAWMISSREDKDNILLFFKVLKQFAGSIHPQWFMSDDTEQYFTAWSDIFGSSQTKKILCAWHIDRAWRKALNQHIPFQDDRV